MILLNFKTYKQASGKSALELIRVVEKVVDQTGVKIFPAVQALDLAYLKPQTQLDLWVQHLDAIQPGRHTGRLSAYTAYQQGAAGVQLNHSENPLTEDQLKKALEICRQNQIKTLVFCADLKTLKTINNLNPDYVCWENPDNVATGQTDFHQAQNVIKQAISVCSAPFLLGAGITSAEDVKTALNLGADGVGLASAFIKTDNSYDLLLSLAQAFIA